jgi:hypothetical protein
MEITIYRRHSAVYPQKLTVTHLVADAPCRVKHWCWPRNIMRKNLREAYDLIDENGACAYNQTYRDRRASPSFARTVEVEMAIFGLPLMAWPMP